MEVGLIELQEDYACLLSDEPIYLTTTFLTEQKQALGAVRRSHGASQRCATRTFVWTEF